MIRMHTCPIWIFFQTVINTMRISPAPRKNLFKIYKIEIIYLPCGLYRPQWSYGVRGYVYIAIEQLDDASDNVLYIRVRLSVTRCGGLQNRRRRVLAIDPRGLLTSSPLLIHYWWMLCSLSRRANQLMGLRQKIYFQRSPLSFPRHRLAGGGHYTTCDKGLF